MTAVSFTVPGVPQSQGSKTPWGTETNRDKLMPWRAMVELAARGAARCANSPSFLPVLSGGVHVDIDLYWPRPKHHYRKNGELTDGAPDRKATRPDVDKCARAILDALTGVLFADDAQVVELTVRKWWSNHNTGHAFVYAQAADARVA